MSDSLALTGTLDAIRDDTQGRDKISVEDIVHALEARGYGPLLMAPALITILPTGAIPGMPDICAALILLISGQILFKRSRPWLPGRLKRFSFDRQKFCQVLDAAKPWTRRVDKIIRPRLEFLASDAMQPLIAIIAILLSIAIVIMGFIPLMAAIPATGVLLLGLGLSGRDGLLLGIAIAVTVGCLAALPYAYNVVFGG